MVSSLPVDACFVSMFNDQETLKTFFFVISVFCSNCVAVSPFDSKVARNKIVFSTGCANAKCVADLKLSSTVLGP